MQRLFSNLEQHGNILKHQPGNWLDAVVLVAGTMVGAGMLALPAVTLPTGVIPSTVLLVGIWLYMAITALLTAEVNLKMMHRSGRGKVGFLAMVEETLGKGWGRLSCGFHLFFHYALLVAYMSEGGDILKGLLESWGTIAFGQVNVTWLSGSLVFVLLFGGVTYLGQEHLAMRFNNGLVTVALIAFLSLLIRVLPQLQPEQLLVQNWHTVSLAIPIMLVAIFYHNVIPVVVTELEGDRRKIRSSILVGSAIPLVMYLVWNIAILTTFDPNVLQTQPGNPGIINPLALLRRGEAGVGLEFLTSVFSECAIATSFIGFTYALLHFFADALNLNEYARHDRFILFMLIVLPPLILTNLNPNLFFEALDAAGSLSVIFLGGVLPVLMVWQQRHQNQSAQFEAPQSETTQLDETQLDETQLDEIQLDEIQNQLEPHSSTGIPNLVPGGRVMLAVMLGMALIVVVEHVWTWKPFS